MKHVAGARHGLSAERHQQQAVCFKLRLEVEVACVCRYYVGDGSFADGLYADVGSGIANVVVGCAAIVN